MIRAVKPRLAGLGFVRPWVGEPQTTRLQNLDGPILGLAVTNSHEIELGDAARSPLDWIPPEPAACQKLYAFDFIEKERQAAQGEAEVADGSGSNAINRLAAVLSAILQPPLAELLQDGPLAWPFPLLEHQQVGIAALLHNRALLLADEMGLGKTIQTLGAIRILCHLGLVRQCLVVAPASLLRQWQKEAALWSPELTLVRITGAPQQRAALWRLPAHVQLVAYETLREDAAGLKAKGRSWDVVVLDEASKIRNAESQVARAAKLLGGTRRWALTGTPIENRAVDFHSILDFLLRGDPGGLHWRRDIRGTLGRLQLRRRKGEVLKDLPALATVTVSLELGAKQRAAYEAAYRESVYQLKELGPALAITHVLELLVRLKQLCNIDPATGESAKMEDIERRLSEAVESGHRALVFSQFVDDNFGVGMVAQRLRAFQPLAFSGALSGKERAAVLDRFERDQSHKALILSLRAGGLGLNLQSASYVFHLDRWWNPAIEDQAESRSHRMGQSLAVTAYRYVCADTIEERIEEVLTQKRELFAQTVDGVSLDPDQVLSRDELLGLFGLG